MSKQKFKTVYFSDHPASDSKEKKITIAFKEPELPYYSKIKNLSNQEIRELIGTESYTQLSLFAEEEERSINQVVKRFIKQNLKQNNKFNSKDITFAGSKTVPFQRWYPYIEGYSPEFVKSLIQHYNLNNCYYIYDPFAGTGTTFFAADQLGIKTIYSEINPLLQFLIQTKISVLKLLKKERKEISKRLLNLSEELFVNIDLFERDRYLETSYKILFKESNYFQSYNFDKLLKIRSFIDNVKLENEILANLLTVSILAIIIPVSNLKKAGDVRFKTKRELEKNQVNFQNALKNKILGISSDLLQMGYSINNYPIFITANSKNIALANNLSIDGVITSPPYLNGTNYFRNTKLELWFLRYIEYENDLRHLRDATLTSGINDVKKNGNENIKNILLKSNILNKTFEALRENAYDNRIPKMALSYFKEIDSVFNNIAIHLRKNSKVIIDIGDSIFANVHIPTDIILIDILKKQGFQLAYHEILRKRRSRNKDILSQSLLVFDYKNKKRAYNGIKEHFWKKNWDTFKQIVPHQQIPFSKRNWGHPNHSLCSYQGKLKPSIGHHLVKTFVPEGGKILDPFVGVGTITLEAALNGRDSFGIDLSLPAYYISYAKVSTHSENICNNYIDKLKSYIDNNNCTEDELSEVKNFGLNKKLIDYYEKNTLNEIILARRFIKYNPPKNPSEMMVVSSLLHILHGNRPYALSRRSHPIIPYAPKGEFTYKNLIGNLKDKVNRTLSNELPIKFKPGKIYNKDATSVWPQEINNLDTIITSPPFFDSTRFYLANWIRLWFSGWSTKDFKYQLNSFIEEKQKKNFGVYENIFRQARERLKKDGVCVMHLGKSHKCDMAEALQNISKKWFKVADIFNEDVAHCESHGIRDKGTTTSHQYLILV